MDQSKQHLHNTIRTHQWCFTITMVAAAMPADLFWIIVKLPPSPPQKKKKKNSDRNSDCRPKKANRSSSRRPFPLTPTAAFAINLIGARALGFLFSNHIVRGANPIHLDWTTIRELIIPIPVRFHLVNSFFFLKKNYITKIIEVGRIPRDRTVQSE